MDDSSNIWFPAHTLSSSRLPFSGAQKAAQTAVQSPLLPTTVLSSPATTERKWPIVVSPSEEHIAWNFSALSIAPQSQSPCFCTQAGVVACSLGRILTYVRTTTEGGLSIAKRFLVSGYVETWKVGVFVRNRALFFHMKTHTHGCMKTRHGRVALQQPEQCRALIHWKYRCLPLKQSRLDSNCHLPSPLRTDLDPNTSHTCVSSALTPFLGNGARTTTKTGVIPRGEVVHGLAPQLTINVCVVRRA